MSDKRNLTRYPWRRWRYQEYRNGLYQYISPLANETLPPEEDFTIFLAVTKKSKANFDIISHPPHLFLASVNDDCDPSTIPVMDSFDIKRFSGKWFELAKTAGGYIDVSDGVWLIEGTNTTNKFLYSGRDNNQHCIRPIKGAVSAAKEPPGMLTLKYQTYSTHVEETVRVLFTDYVSVAVIYT
ncbi:hypothetical protein HNY73_000390 [Argiope bruennichi]|uniref:Uncharacterized protein n=1 Tax=Argiope bruennichi TaxID=94029 RepID=A0A8T0FXY8_ARGBR|nr:hypothetical protein HNY73_000390 [Argiope bruennichi]